MTEEEVIKKLIDIAKDGVKNPLDAYCHTSPCLTCPFQEEERTGCAEGMVNELVDALVKAEEHQKAETNLEHFRGNVIVDMPNSVVSLNLKNGWKESYGYYKDVIDWLLSPYEPPKPKYKLSKFEYDLLKSLTNLTICLPDYSFVKKLMARGYFKDAPEDICIQYILDNCELVEG